eukprot:CAMPEP_0194290370 /NCGR_PEP_ID=MMETSP0169-20130528/41105_1 /TAXON_ID=218684 /ORGANISM="Corethron pennatum, Strain L29A3" /LENGTH=363 /DNA_ID=CAMNT_0039037933 /DNA_START=115 /DNA_END=1207 /DNA_ORIENTATION=-
MVEEVAFFFPSVRALLGYCHAGPRQPPVGHHPNRIQDWYDQFAEQRSQRANGPIIYGTKNKGDRTAALVEEAVSAGFRHIASASSHYTNYNEAGVGAGWTAAAMTPGGPSRKEMFLQTMFLSPSNPDWKPADAATKSMGVEDQVRASLEKSLRDLRTDYVDCFLYHNLKNKLDPLENVLRAWRIMESYVDAGTVRSLGITNVHDALYFDQFYESVRIKPAVVQVRFHSNRQFGMPMRWKFRELGIVEQLFWILTGNGHAILHPATKAAAAECSLTPQQFIYGFILAMGAGKIHPLIGTTNRKHMEEDLEVAKYFDDAWPERKLFVDRWFGRVALKEFAGKVFRRPDLIAHLEDDKKKKDHPAS